MKRKKNSGQGFGRERLIGFIIVLVFIGAILYFFISTNAPEGEIPDYVTGEMRMIYEWSKTSEGWDILEQIPCYCGCKYDGHLHTRHCFWNDDGSFDKHGITCSVCFDIAKKSKEMYEQGEDVCAIRKAVDEFYEPNKILSTETPLPEGCEL